MEHVQTPDHDALGLVAADEFIATVKAKPNALIMPPTGKSPIPMFDEIVRRYKLGEFDASQLRIAQLDEYVRPSTTGDGPCLYDWMDRVLLQPLGITPDRVIRFDANNRDLDYAIRRYENAIQEAGGIDLCILGLGPNGHIGFNEPPCQADSPTRVVKLTPASIISNRVYWKRSWWAKLWLTLRGRRIKLPSHGLTAGMDLILSSKRILLLVPGEGKREILSRLIDGPVTEELPGSFLRTHGNAALIADQAALPRSNPGFSGR